jgi:hypothetical protein
MLWDVWVVDLEIGLFYLTVSGLSFESFLDAQKRWEDPQSILVAIPSGCLLVSNPLTNDGFLDSGKRVECIN